ncbi:MAG TPA: chemotaxis protein CheA [Gemmatimonadales bacterium]
MSSSKYITLFIAESRDHLQQCNTHLLAWEREPSADQPIQGLFRNVHTLKGMAATLGFARLANLAHAFEHVLAAVRDGAVAASAELIQVGFKVVDRLEQGVALAVEGRDDAIEDQELAAELAEWARPATGAFPVPPERTGGPAPEAGGVVVKISFRPGTAMPGARAALVLRRAATLGPLSAVTPPEESWGNEAFEGDFACRIATGAPDDQIRERLSEVGDVAEVAISRGPLASTAAPLARQVRVEQERLDRLVGLSGELSVAGHRLAAKTATLSHDTDLIGDVERLERQLADLQEEVLRARMAPVGEIFERFPRAVRDLARQLDKQVTLDMDGSEIELDRAILDELPDILLHLLRNAVDHGIEPPAARLAAGKPAQGRLVLRARRDRNTVVVTVDDDGRGIDPEQVRARARELGWEDEVDLLRILGRPGFSTKREVTNVSGRGVGIDAVLHRVRTIGGAAELKSTPGQGTSVRLRLPLTLAIVPALLVKVDQERYAVPLGFVVETARLQVSEAVGGALQYRGERLPIVDLGGRKTAARPGVILEVSGRQGALLVDTLLGQENVVVRPVDAPRGLPRWVNGATILADGLPALILDPTGLV